MRHDDGGMVGKPYQQELDRLPETLDWAAHQDINQLHHFLARWKGEHVVVVGSGGSYSAAVVTALLRELAHHSVTTAVTPHEFASLSLRIMPRAFLLSAEGKNRDILFAARTAEVADLAVAAITLTTANPLLETLRGTNAARAFSFQMDWQKDGYLATNSLLGTVLLFYRALFSEQEYRILARLLDAARLDQRRSGIMQSRHLSEFRERGMLLLFSARVKGFAVDLESKLSEAALSMVQVCDLRQFAHGRHLQLANAHRSPAVLIAFSAAERPLVEATCRLIPHHVPVELIEVGGETEQDIAICSLVDAFYFTEAVVAGTGKDPGNPQVPEFGRQIYAMDPSSIETDDKEASCILTVAARRKSGSHPKVVPSQHVIAASINYAKRLANARFKGLICDFDGTLCRTENRFNGADPLLADQLSALIRKGLKLAIATGRGKSLHGELSRAFDEDLHSLIQIGFYSGGYVISLDQQFTPPPPNEQFSDLWEWLMQSAHDLPTNRKWQDFARGGQLSFRAGNSQDSKNLLSSIQTWIRRTERKGWRAFSSGHSVDVLDEHTSKSNVVKKFTQLNGFDPATDVLRIGDCGQEVGNDFELLSEGLSLSCDAVSAALDSCWNFGALGNSQAEVTLSYVRALTFTDGTFRLSPGALPFLEKAVTKA